ncbi:MAG: hypothetical protein AABZ10_11470, partial [Nitrospirota bacterium]
FVAYLVPACPDQVYAVISGSGARIVSAGLQPICARLLKWHNSLLTQAVSPPLNFPQFQEIIMEGNICQAVFSFMFPLPAFS